MLSWHHENMGVRVLGVRVLAQRLPVNSLRDWEMNYIGGQLSISIHPEYKPVIRSMDV
jgi:hypothetical protein